MHTMLTRSARRLLCAALLGLAILASPARADREQVRKAMDALEAAVLAADKDAYLAHVWSEDAVFLQEQKAWAADFDRHRAKAFTLTLDEEEEARFGPEEARFTMVMAWSMGEDVPNAGSRRVSYPVVFKKKADAWLYAGEDWIVLEAPGVDGSAGAVVKYLDNAEHPARNVIEVLPEVRARVDEGFENKIERVQEVKLYNSMRHLQASIYLSYTDGLSGWNEPGEAIKLSTDACGTKRMARVLVAHEYGHCATFEYGPHASKMPWWVLEGVAELAAEEFGRSRTRINAAVELWAKRGNLAPWDEMADFHTCPDKWMGHVYTQGHHMIGFISEKHGRTGRNAWLRAMATGKTIDEATREALGMSFAELHEAWRAALPAQETAAEPAPAGG